MPELLKEGPLRKWLREREPLIPRRKLISSSLSPEVTRLEVDSALKEMKEAKKRDWRARGYSENLIGMAEDLSDEWITSMARAWATDMPEVQRAIVRANYGKALDVADRWIRKIGEAVKKG